MSHLRVLICRVEDETEEMTELTSLDLPSVWAHRAAMPLDTLEAQVAQVGQRLLGRLCELAWEEVDAEAVARYSARQAPGSVVADGEATLQVASRFGTLHLRRQVVAHRDGRPHVLPGNALLPEHQGILITRGLREMACLLPQDVPFVTAARLLGWWAGEPGLLCASTLRTLVRDHGGRIRDAGADGGRLPVARALSGTPSGGCARRAAPAPPWLAQELSAAVEAALAQNRCVRLRVSAGQIGSGCWPRGRRRPRRP